MFSHSDITSINLSHFDTGSVIRMYSMFESCKNLTSLNLSSFNMKNVISTVDMFNGCTKLKTLELWKSRTYSLTVGLDF